MKLSPQGTAGASGELFPPVPNYIVQSQCGKCLGIVRKLLAFGTGQLVAVGDMDRENWDTDLAAMPNSTTCSYHSDHLQPHGHLFSPLNHRTR